MNQLKLKYIIELVSNIGQKSSEDLQRLRQAQSQIRVAVERTSDSLKQQGDTAAQAGTAAARGASVLERAQENSRRAAERTTREIFRMVPALRAVDQAGSRTMQRQLNYLDKLAQGWKKTTEAAQNARRLGVEVGASAAAAGYAADRMTRAPMEYDAKLAGMANTAYRERDQEGRISGMRSLDAAVRAAVRAGGGTKDSAADALGSMIASNSVSVDQAIAMLPALTRTATAGNADTTDLSKIATAAVSNMNIPVGEIRAALNDALVAGAEGGFELKDMAKWLPEIMTSASSSGMSGRDDFRTILAAMQASRKTAGSADKAGNNLMNLFGKISASDTRNDFKKLGLDLPQELAQARAKGVNALDAFVGLADKVVGRDPRFQKAQKELARAKGGGEETAALESIKGIFQGAGLSSIIQDREAMLGLLGVMNNRDYMQNIRAGMRSDKGETDTAFGVMAGRSSFKREQAFSEASFARDTAFEQVAPVLNRIFDTGTDVARQFPILTASTIGLVGAFGVLSAALGASGLVGLLSGKGLTAGGAGMARVAGMAAGGLGSAALVAGAGGAGYAAGRGLKLYERMFEGNAAGDMLGRSVAGVLSFLGNEEARNAMQAEYAGRNITMNSPLRRPGAGALPVPDYLSITGPGPAAAAMTAAPIAPLGALRGGGALGQGEIRVVVESKDGTKAQASVTQPMPGMKLDMGNTNPAGYKK